MKSFVEKRAVNVSVSRMERAYREDELLESMIIDSEGYIYGKVDKINIDEGKIVLVAYESKPDVKMEADVDSLKKELLKNVQITFNARLHRLAPAEILAKNIQTELKLGIEEPLTDQHYVKYAERLGISMPHTKVSVERKEPKGTVNLQEIKTIRITVIGKEKETKVYKVILLQKPREAAFRKIPVQEKVPYRSTEAIKDKLVLDADGNTLGYVDSVVLFQNTLGIRVYLSKTSGQVSLSLLNRHLEEIGRPDVAKSLQKHFAEPGAHRYAVNIEDIEDFMESKGHTFILPKSVMMSQSVKEFVADIPWDQIHKIGDVVLLKTTLPNLRSKGYLKG